MTWTTQVRHVFVRSLAETWVSLAALVAIIAVVTTQAVVGALDGIWAGMLLTYASQFAILLHLALVVQADPPPHSTSFWATQPRRPSAVATAMLLQAGLVLLLLTAASLITLSAWHYGDVTGWVAIVAQLRYGALMALTVMFVAALYPQQARSSVGAALLCLAYSNLVEQDSRVYVPGARFVMQAVDILPGWSWVVVVALLAMVFIWRYGRAELTTRAGMAAMTLSLLPFALLMRSDGTPPRGVANATPAPPLALTLETRGDYISFELQAPQGLPGDAYRLVNWGMIATRKNGETVRLTGSDDILRRIDGRRAVVRLLGDSLDVIGGAFLNMHDSTGFHEIVGSFGPFTNNNLDDVISARLEGTVESYRMNEVDRLPLRTGLALLRDGRRAELTVRRGDTDGPALWLQTKWLGGTASDGAAWPVAAGMRASELSFALVNHARGSMLPLRVENSEHFGIGSMKMGFGVKAHDYTLRPAIWTLPIPPVDSAWLAGAELVVGSPVRSGAVRIRVDGAVTQPVSRRRQPFSR